MYPVRQHTYRGGSHCIVVSLMHINHIDLQEQQVRLSATQSATKCRSAQGSQGLPCQRRVSIRHHNQQHVVGVAHHFYVDAWCTAVVPITQAPLPAGYPKAQTIFSFYWSAWW
jgi:hypothetical protein